MHTPAAQEAALSGVPRARGPQGLHGSTDGLRPTEAPPSRQQRSLLLGRLARDRTASTGPTRAPGSSRDRMDTPTPRSGHSRGTVKPGVAPRGVSAGKTLILSLCPHLKNTNNKVCPIKMGRELTEEGSGVLSPEPTRIIIIMFSQSDGAKLQPPQHVSSPPSVLFFLAVPGLRRYHTRAFTFSFL